jgi:butyryl-CoA dehydrogenase
LVKPDGTLGERNDVQCASIEHKMGINANPTCTLNYGEKTGGAIGYLVGEPHRGMEYMFIMMNAARFSVGVQGLAIADRAYQSALAYAKERVQSRDIKDSASRSAQAVTIFHHPDVRRMLMWMKAQIEAMRALAYVTAASLDFSNKSPDEAVRKEHRAFVEFMIPIVKGWCTEAAIDICSTALQTFGGMGFIEETGIAQQYRDVRITAIYEGTTGIQALDLVGRKLLRDTGKTATALVGKMKTFAAELANVDDPDVKAIHAELVRGIDALATTSQAIGADAMSDLRLGVACSVPYLKLWGIVAGGWQMARAAQIAAAKIAARDADADFYKAKLATARFYADHVLTQARWLQAEIQQGAASVMSLSEEQFELDRKSAVTA